MNRNLFVILIVVLIVFFVTGVGAGVLRADNKTLPDWQMSAVEGLDELIPKAALKVNDIRSPEPQACMPNRDGEITVRSATTCEFTIVPASMPRQFMLRLADGRSVDVVLTQPVNEEGARLTIEHQIERNGEIELTVYRKRSDADRIKLGLKECVTESGQGNCILHLR